MRGEDGRYFGERKREGRGGQVEKGREGNTREKEGREVCRVGEISTEGRGEEWAISRTADSLRKGDIEKKKREKKQGTERYGRGREGERSRDEIYKAKGPGRGD